MSDVLGGLSKGWSQIATKTTLLRELGLNRTDQKSLQQKTKPKISLDRLKKRNVFYKTFYNNKRVFYNLFLSNHLTFDVEHTANHKL